MDVPRSLNLPPIISSNVPEELKVLLKEEPMAIPPSRIIIVHSKDISNEDKDACTFWGKALVWNDHFINIPFKSLPACDYLLIDIRNKNARIALGAEDLSLQKVVCFISWFHKEEAFINQLKALAFTSFPTRSSSKEDFDRQLLNEKMKAPSVAKRLINFFFRCVVDKY